MDIRKILFAVLCTAALFSCKKEEVFQPATISGNWVFSSTNTGSGWNDLKVTRLYCFDGSGSYIVKDLESGSTTYYNGQVYVEESDFVQSDQKTYAVKYSGDKYRFETLQGDYILTTDSASEKTFEVTENGSVTGYRLSKVESYKQHEDPKPDPQPDPTPDPDPSKPSINGTELIEGNDLVGLVYDGSTAKGIPGVVVSDGYDCVATDANGVYQFKSNSLTRVVFISTPSEYAIPVESSPSVPVFYKAVKPDGAVMRNDFKLTPLEGGKETNWTFIGIGDPQCATASNANRYAAETIPDIKETFANQKHVYAMTLGDIVFDSTNMWPTMKKNMSSVYNGAWFIPFFQTMGNHDHDSLKDDTTDNAMDDYNATSTFVSYFGPENYSFNRGDVHVVAMDDIIVTSKKTSSKSNGYTWSYNAGFTAKQLQWLLKDLSLVPDKENKMIFICCHIPFRSTTTNYMGDVLRKMTDFKEAHLMIGHTHYTQNYIHSGTKAKGGLAVYEHIHGSACGSWWTGTCSSTVTGEPSGYTWYEIEGAHIKDWHFKGTRRNGEDQLRVYDGNDIYYESKYPLNWYTASQKIGTYTFTVKGNANLKGCFVAQLFNDDSSFWKVELVKKSTGEKIGSFIRLADGTATNIAMSAFYYNAKSKTSDSYCSKTASHYWYYKPASGSPSDETDWEVVVTQTLPAGDVTHTFKCSKITRQADFASAFYF